jgi:hypothetical protein
MPATDFDGIRDGLGVRLDVSRCVVDECPDTLCPLEKLLHPMACSFNKMMNGTVCFLAFLLT